MNQDETIRFIELYKSHPVLYDMKHRNFRVKKEREEAWKEMSESMKIPVPILKEKMRNLMGTYRSEKSRERKNYSNSGHPYKSNWFALKYMEFLGNRKATGNMDSMAQVTEDSKSHLTSQLLALEAPVACALDSALEISATSVGHRRTKKSTLKRKIVHPDNDVNITDDDPDDRDCQSSLKKSSKSFTTDPYVSYGQYIANELRKYDLQTLAYVKRAISDVLFEADMGTLMERFGPTSLQSSTVVQSDVLYDPILMSPSILPSSGDEDENACVS